MSLELGYSRVSTKEQNSEAHRAELEAAGCDLIFIDHGVSSRIRDRPQWLECRKLWRPGARLTTPKLDRLAGSDTMMLGIAAELAELPMELRVLREPQYDTNTAMGRALLGFSSVLLQLRVDAIRENTLAGLEYARSQGRVGGRPTVMTPDRIAQAVRMRAEDEMPYRQIARVLGVGEASVRRALSALESTD